MAHRPIIRVSRTAQRLELARDYPTLFLVPALPSILPCPPSRPSKLQSTTTRPFSTTLPSPARSHHRDANKNRGVSAIRRTGPRYPLTISKYPLPEPVWDPPARKEFKTRDDHGLWGFFNEERRSLTKPEDLDAHGRAWTYAELANKTWDDLWKIWWECLRERNWLATEAKERVRVEAGYGDYEGGQRDKTIKKTMLTIKRVLVDRSDAFDEAMKITNSPAFWKREIEETDREENGGMFADEYERDDVLARLESGRPMVDGYGNNDDVDKVQPVEEPRREGLAEPPPR